VRYKFHNNNN